MICGGMMRGSESLLSAAIFFITAVGVKAKGAGPPEPAFRVGSRVQTVYRVPICPKGSLSYSDPSQGDTAGCLKPPVDFSTEVLFWPGLAWPGQAKTEL